MIHIPLSGPQALIALEVQPVLIKLRPNRVREEGGVSMWQPGAAREPEGESEDSYYGMSGSWVFGTR